MVVTITYFVHGTTTDNEKHLATGQAHGELGELGIQQSKDLGHLVAHKQFDVVFTSDLNRAIISADLAFKDKYQIIQDKRLRECDYGDLTQQPCSEFKDEMEKYVENRFPNGESYKEVEARMRDFLQFLKENYDGKHVAIVAHEAPQLAIEVIINGRTWEQAITENWRRRGAWQPG